LLMHNMPVVFLAGLAAGAMNAAAGGGSFVSVPALIYTGIPSVSSNMSSTIALYPGSIASAWVYRGRFLPILEMPIKALIMVTLAGGLCGALLLLLTTSAVFDKIIPWLLLLGSIAFAFGPWIGKRLRRYYRPNTTFLLLIQFILGVYGGYFGGGVGIMMMAVWSVLGLSDIQAMNATKVVLVAAANTVAVLCFAAFGSVVWGATLVMMVAAAAGGYLGAHLALRIKPFYLRIGISVVNFLIAGVFFWTKYA
jgi:uncharacterized protein